MGDRAWVSLTIAEKHRERAEAIMDTYDYVPAGCDIDSWSPGTITYGYDDVNYGDLDYRAADGEGVLENLRIAGIPYDVEWEAGCEYPAGGDYFRVLENGTHSLTEVPERATAGMVAISDIMEIIYPALRDPDVVSYSVDAVNDIKAFLDDRVAEYTPPMTLVENAQYV